MCFIASSKSEIKGIEYLPHILKFKRMDIQKQIRGIKDNDNHIKIKT